MNAIVLDNVVKHFRKRTVRREYTTVKSALVDWLTGRSKNDATANIEALRGVNLTVPTGKTVGILGRNGSGKSTLLKLMTGIYTPTSGSLKVNGRVSALLELGAGFHPDFSGRENILINGIILGMSRAEVRKRMDEIIEFSELAEFIDEPVRTYSSGMYMRLAFSVATHVDPEILIVDEILAVGDEHFGRKSMAKMMEFKRQGKTIVLVSHDLGAIQKWCDLAAWIDGGVTRAFGSPADVVTQYRAAVELAEAKSLPPPASVAGGALPDLPERQPAQYGPSVSPETRWGDFQVEIDNVELTDARGTVPATFDTEQAVELTLRYVAKAPVSDVGFGLLIWRADGAMVFTTNTFADGISLPRPLPERGVLKIQIPRLGLIAGMYFLDVTAHRADGTAYDYHRGLYQFEVKSPIPDGGITRPPHAWSHAEETLDSSAGKLARAANQG